MTDEQPEPFFLRVWLKALAVASGDAIAFKPKQDYAAALTIQRAFAEREEHARAERRNIISHATMGSTTGEGMSVNDVCVDITRQRNKLYQAGKNSAEADLVGAAKEAIERTSFNYKARNGRECYIEDDGGERCVIIPHEAYERLRAALKLREAGHG